MALVDIPYNRSYPYLYRGEVLLNDDPEGLGRCKIRVPSVFGDQEYEKYNVDMLPWARPLATSPVSKGRGSYNIPDIGDIVWVLFEGGTKEFPVYLGGTYGMVDLEGEGRRELELPITPGKVLLYKQGDDEISCLRGIGTKRLILLKIGNTRIIVNEDEVTIQGDVVIKGNLTADNIVANEMIQF